MSNNFKHMIKPIYSFISHICLLLITLWVCVCGQLTELHQTNNNALKHTPLSWILQTNLINTYLTSSFWILKNISQCIRGAFPKSKDLQKVIKSSFLWFSFFRHVMSRMTVNQHQHNADSPVNLTCWKTEYWEQIYAWGNMQYPHRNVCRKEVYLVSQMKYRV